MRGKRVIVASILVLAAALLASGVIAGQFRSADPEALHEALTSGEVVQVAEIAAADGLARRGVFVQETDIGQLCLWDVATPSTIHSAAVQSRRASPTTVVRRSRPCVMPG
jgi:hypothetical protein